MKRLLYISIIIITAAACKREALTTYDVDNNIYFGIPGANAGVYADTLDFTFAYSDASVKDTLIPVPVNTTGDPMPNDRRYKLEVDPASTAVAAVHYELPELLIRSGKVRDTLWLRLKRAQDLTTGTKKLVIRLVPNENFKTNIQYRLWNTAFADTTDVLTYSVTMSDILSAGPYWNQTYARYFGKFSVKKVMLIHDMLDMPLNFWSFAQPSPQQRSAAVYYASVMGRYLSDEAASGHIILDEDGTPMQMGPGY